MDVILYQLRAKLVERAKLWNVSNIPAKAVDDDPAGWMPAMEGHYTWSMKPEHMLAVKIMVRDLNNAFLV